MRRRIAGVLTALLLLFPLAMSTVSAQDEALITVSMDPNLGAILTDSEGKTLYLFTQDTTADESVCYDNCAVNWPIVTPDKATGLAAGIPGELKVIDRTDGTQMVAYNGIPLYYYIADEAAGDTTGQNVGGVWFVVPPGASHGPYAAAPGEGTPVPSASLSIGFTEELGPFLTDPEGKTLYLFTNDTEPGETTCYDDCAVNWPPMPAGDAMLLPPGIQGTLSAVDRTDGTTMLAYNDIPLYYYIADEAAGDTNGQDVGEVWYIVPPGMMHGDEPHHGMEEMGNDVATPTS
jgi:predicted lipoprotein with Yx(FWY)xxD motif